VITHPARFKMAQLADLKTAVLAAFGSQCRISTLQEPVAAALNVIVRGDEKKAESYTLGVFDFGGGTTDISILSVKHTHDDGLTDIEPVLVSSTGEWFGGEDLTRFILERAHARCLEMAPEKVSDAQADVPIEYGSIADPHLRWLARVNKDTLFRWAEATKLLLIDRGDDHIAELDRLAGFPTLKLHVFASAGVREVVFEHVEVVPQFGELDKYLRSRLSSLAQTMQGLVNRSGLSTLNYILLSGLSSRIPAVAEILQNSFPQAQIVPASKPKECVVAGACIPVLMQGAVHASLTIGVLSFTISRIGLRSFDGVQYFFDKLIDAGEPIPAEGLLATKRIQLAKAREIIVLENDSESNNQYRDNVSISELGRYTLEPWPEQLHATGTVRCTLEFRIFPNLDFTIQVRVSELPEPLRLIKRQEDRKEIEAHAS
jgi:molecular chaperone DnaK (HSP70)